MANITDTLMKQPRARQAADDQELVAEQAKARSEYMALDTLLKTGAWVVILDKLHGEEMDILAKLELSQDPTTLAKLVGSLLANKAQQVWPERRMAELRQFLTQA